MDTETKDRTVPEYLSAQGRMTDHREAAKEARGRGGRRDYPTLSAAMAESGFKEIGVYFMRRQNTVAQYIATRPIMALCGRSTQKPGMWVSWRLWDQDGFYLEGSKERSAGDFYVEEVQKKD